MIVEDHPIVRAGLRRLLAAEANVEVRETADGREALSLYREQRPALVILDLNLPGLGGLEMIGRLRAADPEARILVLSMHDDETHVTRALQAGAMGYVTKNADPDELLAAIARVAQGENHIEREIAEAIVFARLRSPPNPLQELSARDLEILRLLANGRSLPQIADTLGIGYKTAANNCTRIKARLGAASTAELIRIAIRCGLVDRDAGRATLRIDKPPSEI
ncbi:MAG: response regulator transcription factor [Alphaproteobacteria bacterium]|nr:response regulator transcription factor [Alphaproteobacteria bacterium]